MNCQHPLRLWHVLLLAAFLAGHTWGQEASAVTVGVFEFQVGESVLPQTGVMVAELLGTELSGEAGIQLVERARLDELISEMKLSSEGVAAPEHAVRAGRLLGANVILSGVVFDVGDRRSIVARLVSCETSRMVGTVGHVSGNDLAKLTDLIPKMATELHDRLQTKRPLLAPSTITFADLAKRALADQTGEKLPSVWVAFTCPRWEILGSASTERALAMLQAAGLEKADSPEQAGLSITGQLDTKPLDEIRGRASAWVSLQYRFQTMVEGSGSESITLSSQTLAQAQTEAADVLLQHALLSALGSLHNPQP